MVLYPILQLVDLVLVLPFCSKCGEDVNEDAEFCPNCGENLSKSEVRGRPIEAQGGAMNHLNLGFNLATSKPMVFVPVILSGVISILISTLSSSVIGSYGWRFWQGSGGSSYPVFTSFFLIAGLLSLVSSIISYILNFASIDMSRDAYLDKPLNLMGSINYVLRRIFTFIMASIIGAIMAITIILIPVVSLMFVIMVLDETGIGDAISKAFSVLTRNLGDIIVILLVAIIGSAILGMIPYIGSLLSAGLNVITGLAFISLYSQNRQ
jgi:hypothetical protein